MHVYIVWLLFLYRFIACGSGLIAIELISYIDMSMNIYVYQVYVYQIRVTITLEIWKYLLLNVLKYITGNDNHVQMMVVVVKVVHITCADQV